jgi:hypothetical protein
MDLTFLQFPLKNRMVGRLLNVPITGDHVQDITHPIDNDKAQNEMIQTLQKYSPEDMPFATEEDFDQIEWPKKEEYQQLLDEFKNKEIGTVKILKKHEDDVQIHPSQQEFLQRKPTPLPQYNTPGLSKERPNTKSKSTRRETWYGCRIPRKESQLM